VSLVRACRHIGGAEAVKVLRQHVAPPDRDVGLVIMRALALLGTEPIALAADLEHSTRLLRALVVLEGNGAADTLRSALRDELDLVRQRVLAGLAVAHGSENVGTVAFQLAQHDAHSHALALEWLEVTLSESDRAAVAMVQPGLSDGERLRLMSRWFPLGAIDELDLLRQIVEDSAKVWRRPWIRACALHAAAALSPEAIDWVSTAEGPTEPGHSADEAIIHETLAVIRARRRVA
jgi:hypothetical protein